VKKQKSVKFLCVLCVYLTTLREALSIVVLIFRGEGGRPLPLSKHSLVLHIAVCTHLCIVADKLACAWVRQAADLAVKELDKGLLLLHRYSPSTSMYRLPLVPSHMYHSNTTLLLLLCSSMYSRRFRRRCSTLGRDSRVVPSCNS
jgi:hypothetical protein